MASMSCIARMACETPSSTIASRRNGASQMCPRPAQRLQTPRGVRNLEGVVAATVAGSARPPRHTTPQQSPGPITFHRQPPATTVMKSQSLHQSCGLPWPGYAALRPPPKHTPPLIVPTAVGLGLLLLGSRRLAGHWVQPSRPTEIGYGAVGHGLLLPPVLRRPAPGPTNQVQRWAL